MGRAKKIRTEALIVNAVFRSDLDRFRERQREKKFDELVRRGMIVDDLIKRTYFRDVLL